eukprot:TRINITY_DN6310_c0_g1_i2.p1 TRINITY_DN6310_c0_g1~~TRINITY_DN6310_c0_g1_i2.p1  ORF type:complete len:939 (-),score=210.77 TRINITY_DN6310_c0_g1_i2:108-2924(-)
MGNKVTASSENVEQKKETEQGFITYISETKRFKCVTKLVLVGESGVGKSSFALRLVRNVFSEFCESTIGAAFLRKNLTVDDIDFQFELWDTAGQERYRSLAVMYYRNAQIVFVLYDITAEDTLETAIGWIKQIRNDSPSVIFMLMANKTDLPKRKISTEKGMQAAWDNGALFVEASARQNTNISLPFDMLAKALKRNIDGMSMEDSVKHTLAEYYPELSKQLPSRQAAVESSEKSLTASPRDARSVAISNAKAAVFNCIENSPDHGVATAVTLHVTDQALFVTRAIEKPSFFQSLFKSARKLTTQSQNIKVIQDAVNKKVLLLKTSDNFGNLLIMTEYRDLVVRSLKVFLPPSTAYETDENLTKGRSLFFKSLNHQCKLLKISSQQINEISLALNGNPMEQNLSGDGLALLSVNLRSALSEPGHWQFVKILAQCLLWNSSVTKLDLSKNGIKGEDAIRAVANLLVETVSLKELNLSSNDLDQNCGTLIGQALESNTTLEILRLDNNTKLGQGGIGIAAALARNNTLQVLNLAHNKLQSDFAKVLAKSLVENKSLKELDLWANEIGVEGAAALLAVIGQNDTLKTLSLVDNGISDAVLRKLTRPAEEVAVTEKIEVPAQSTPAQNTSSGTWLAGTRNNSSGGGTMRGSASAVTAQAVPYWQFSSDFLSSGDWLTKDFYRSLQLDRNSNEFKNVENTLNDQMNGSQYEITKIFAVQNDDLERAFQIQLKILEDRLKNRANIFLSEDWRDKQRSDWRDWTLSRLKDYKSKFSHHTSSAKVIPVLHGTKADKAWSICRTGFAAVGIASDATTDAGYFGKGIYFTSHLDYAALDCYSSANSEGEKVLILCYIVVGNTYPCIEHPQKEKDELYGKGCKPGYDSHFAVVEPADDSPSCAVFFPCQMDSRSTRIYNEFVLFQGSQVLPRYVITIKPKTKAPTPRQD